MSKPTPWCRLALRLLPNAFRRRFGAEFAEAFEALAADALSRGGRLRQARYILAELLSLARLALALRAPAPFFSSGRTPAGRAGMREGMMLDLRWAWRYARRRPWPALAMVVTIGLSVGAATTAFGLASAVLWRPVPFDDAERLVFVWEKVERDGQPNAARVTGARFAAWREAAGEMARLSLFGAAGFTIETPAGRSSVRGLRVSADYFETLGIRPALGRTFRPGEETPGAHRVIILSSAMWRERFGGRQDVIGTRVHLSGEPFTVVGVMPPAAFPAWPVNPAHVTLDPDSRQFWVPIQRTPELQHNARAHVFGAVARLPSGIDARQLGERLDATTDTRAADPHGARVEPFRQQFVADARAPLVALAAASLALLLIACANLAALQASAFESRRAELSMRLAIGARPWQLVRQVVVELLLRISAGTVLGVLLARIALAGIPGRLPPAVPLLATPGLDPQTVGFAVLLALIATGLVSGWPVARLLLSSASPRGTRPQARAGVYRVLVVAQIAIAVALTSAAGLLGRSLRTVEAQDPGFSLERLLVADVGMPPQKSADGARAAAVEAQLLSAISTRPGVEAVATAYDHPLEANWSENPTIAGDAAAEAQQVAVDLRIVSAGYVEALGVELLDGRTLSERDTFGAPGAAMVNEAFARQIGGRVIGRRISTSTPAFMFPSAPREYEIVGVVANERFRGLEQAALPAYYLSTRQFPQPSLTLLVRTSGDPIGHAADIRSAVRTFDPAITVDRVTTIDRILDEQLVSRRVTADVIGGFAATALVLAALGMYGLLMVAVGSERREIGIRLAIGASPVSIARRTLAYAVQNAMLGVLLGCLLALVTGRSLQGLLVGVSASDPFLLGTTAAVLLGAAVAAAVLPAIRAARVDPLAALRQE